MKGSCWEKEMKLHMMIIMRKKTSMKFIVKTPESNTTGKEHHDTHSEVVKKGNTTGTPHARANSKSSLFVLK